MPQPSLLGFLQDKDSQRAVGRGLLDAANRGWIAQTFGAPVDMATQAVNLGIAGAGYLGHKAGLFKQPPELLDSARVPGSSEWIGQKMQNAGMVSPNRNPIAEAGMGLLSPVAFKGAQKVGGLLANAEMKAAQNLAQPSTMRAKTQRGIFAGEWAKTADKAAMKTAQDMDANKADPRTIWSETGWFKGPDGKWRFEIDDSGSAMRGVDPSEYIVQAFRSGGVDAAKAARADMEGYLPPYRQRGRNMELSDVFSHRGLMDAYPDVMRSTRYRVAKDGQIGEGAYSPSHNFIELVPADMPTAKSGMLHELQHAVQQAEGFAKGGSPDDMRSVALDMLRRDVASGAIGSTEQAMDMLPMAQENAYRRLLGEAEARAVQSRMNLNADQRRALFPLDSYDVPIDSLIIR